MGWGEPSPGTDVVGVSPVPVQMWDGASPVPVQMWDGASPVPVQMWDGASPVPVLAWQSARAMSPVSRSAMAHRWFGFFFRR